MRRTSGARARPQLEDLAHRLTQDLATVGPDFSALVVPLESTDPDRLSSYSVPEEVWRGGAPLVLIDVGITVVERRFEWFRMVFFDGYDLAPQFADRLSFVQTEIQEETTEPWPRCPSLNHPMDPWVLDGDVVWRCMASGSVVAPLGDLAAVPRVHIGWTSPDDGGTSRQGP